MNRNVSKNNGLDVNKKRIAQTGFLLIWVRFNDCRGWKKCEKVRKNATFARYLGAILCNLKQKKMYSSEFFIVL